MDYAADQQLEKISPTLTYCASDVPRPNCHHQSHSQRDDNRLRHSAISDSTSPARRLHRLQNSSVVAVHRYKSICSHNPPHGACLGRKPTNAVVVEHPANPFSKLNAGRRSILLRDFVWVITTQHRRQHCIAPCCMLHTAATVYPHPHSWAVCLSRCPQPYAVSQPSHNFSCTA